MNTVQKDDLEGLLDTNIMGDYTDEMDQLSFLCWDNDSQLGGEFPYLSVPGGGYAPVINRYAAAIMPNVKLRAVVHRKRF